MSTEVLYEFLKNVYFNSDRAELYDAIIQNDVSQRMRDDCNTLLKRWYEKGIILPKPDSNIPDCTYENYKLDPNVLPDTEIEPENKLFSVDYKMLCDRSVAYDYDETYDYDATCDYDTVKTHYDENLPIDIQKQIQNCKYVPYVHDTRFIREVELYLHEISDLPDVRYGIDAMRECLLHNQVTINHAYADCRTDTFTKLINKFNERPMMRYLTKYWVGDNTGSKLVPTYFKDQLERFINDYDIVQSHRDLIREYITNKRFPKHQLTHDELTKYKNLANEFYQVYI